MNADKLYAWRVLLGKLTSELRERQRIADVLNVNTITLTRWATNKSNPRMDNLRLLLQALPSHRQQLVELIREEFPDFLMEDPSQEELLQEIPSAFYTHVLRAHASRPPFLRTSSLRITILQQILGHLDPMQLGMAVSISLCIPPSQGQKVRSLREDIGRGSLPWRSHLESHTQFLGIESLPGYAVSRGYAVIVQSCEEKSLLFPTHHVEWEESAVAHPLLLSDKAAGCLYVSSTQQNYFSDSRQELIAGYADLLVLAFEPDEFYDIKDIELGTMPPYSIQQPYLHRFQQRISQYMRDMQSHRPITRLEAEQTILQQLEEELLWLPYNTDADSDNCDRPE